MPEPKPVSASASQYTAWAQPNDANALGTLFGGRLMQWVDLAAALAAARHARCTVVTASVDSMTFLRPIRIGQLVILRSSVNRVFRTSMEVGVKVYVEDLHSGDRAHVSSAYLTFVAVSPEGQRVQLPPVLPETEAEKRRFAAAGHRREYRLQLRTRELEHEKQTNS
ncbi:MAG: acyl-CoA thioesterase [Bryobacterales bacterium]|nr:acyl-CoA thioesterase [Bryobacterales bacterium]